MLRLTLLVLFAFSLLDLAYAGAALWTQCGGIGWTGPTVCDAGVCTRANDYFYQCLPGTTTTSKTTTTTTTSVSTTTCYTNLPTYSAIAVKATTPNTAVTSLALHKRSDKRAVLNGSGALYPYLHSNTICFIEPGSGCQYKDYLNIYDDPSNPTASYKIIQYDLTGPVTTYWSTSYWGVSTASPWGAQSWFLACPTSVASEYLLYLQTGTDVPYGQNCTLTQLT